MESSSCNTKLFFTSLQKVLQFPRQYPFLKPRKWKRKDLFGLSTRKLALTAILEIVLGRVLKNVAL